MCRLRTSTVIHRWSKVLILSGHNKAHNDDDDDPVVTAKCAHIKVDSILSKLRRKCDVLFTVVIRLQVCVRLCYSDLTLLVGWQERYLACKNTVFVFW